MGGRFGGGGAGGVRVGWGSVFVKIQKKKIFFFFFGGGGWVGGRSGWGVRVDVNEELKFLRKFTKKKNRGVGGVFGLEGVFGCCFFFFFFFFLGGGGQGGCERRIEVLVKIPKKNGGGVGVGSEGCSGWRGVGFGGVRVDVNEELKFLGKFTHKKIGGGGGSEGGVR